MRISSRVALLQSSPTLALVARTAELRAAGRDIVSFGAGEPDFDTPVNIREAAKRAMDEGRTHYTPVPGVAPLRQAVSDVYRTQWDLEYPIGDVLVTSGAKHALFEALLALVEDGDRVVVPAPYWVSYPEMVKAAGGTPVFVECSEADGFRLRPEALRRAAVGARVLIFNGVCNPTGAVHSHDDTAALAEVCEELDLSVISDEIYERLVYDGFETIPFAASRAGARERTICVSGVSKTFAMTGWRIGWAVGPSGVIGAMRKLQSQSTSNACSVAQFAALEALTGPQDEMDRMKAEFLSRRNRMVELVNAIPGVEVSSPGGAFYVMVRVDDFFGRRDGISDAMTLAAALLDESSLAVVPGTPFGAPHHIRLSYACSMHDIERGIARLHDFLAGDTRN